MIYFYDPVVGRPLKGEGEREKIKRLIIPISSAHHPIGLLASWSSICCHTADRFCLVVFRLLGTRSRQTRVVRLRVCNAMTS